jgi:uncharacterized repeat protein (TIGR03803 family)
MSRKSILGVGAMAIALTACSGMDSSSATPHSNMLARIAAPGSAGGITTLHSFQGGIEDGGFPMGGVFVDKSGKIFGTTASQGAYDYGTVFELTPSGNTYDERIIHNLSYSTDGSEPQDRPFMDEDGNLFVTAWLGPGNFGGGTAIELHPVDGSYNETKVVLFKAPGGEFPAGGGLTSRGTRLYATAAGGGANNVGAIEALSESTLQKQDVYDFKGPPSDGGGPNSILVGDGKGNLYGTTSYGGAANEGTVFELTPSPGGDIETVLWTFRGGKDGAYPVAGVIFDAAGHLYGVASAGGTANKGVIFRLTRAGNGYHEAILHAFTGSPSDGDTPVGGMVMKDQTLWGTTWLGGAGGAGTIFRVSPTGADYSVYHDFNGTDGSAPLGTLFSTERAIYGTTQSGTHGEGTVFSIP